MANTVVWDGLKEFQEQLRQLPEACTGEAGNLITGAVNAVAHDIKGAYPVRTGNLRDHLVIAPLTKRGLVTGAAVKNTAKHALIWENGTQVRHTSLGANRGSMPPGHNFVPKIVRARRALTQQLKDMVARHGAVVIGEP